MVPWPYIQQVARTPLSYSNLLSTISLSHAPYPSLGRFPDRWGRIFNSLCLVGRYELIPLQLRNVLLCKPLVRLVPFVIWQSTVQVASAFVLGQIRRLSFVCHSMNQSCYLRVKILQVILKGFQYLDSAQAKHAAFPSPAPCTCSAIL